MYQPVSGVVVSCSWIGIAVSANLLIRDQVALEFSKCMSSKAAVKILSLFVIFVACLLVLF